MARVQSSDQLVNFRALSSELTAVQSKIAKLEQENARLRNDLGILNLDKYSQSAAAAAPAGSANAVDVNVDFGSTFTHYAETTVTGITWANKSLAMVVSPKADDLPEVALLSFQPVVNNVTNGDGFTLSVYTPIEAKGTYTFSCIGVEP